MRPEFASKDFLKSEAGTVAVIWALALVMVIGFTALIFDVGRVGATQSELQAYADHVALAAAAELDGSADAITQARAAANRLISQTQTFATGARLLNTEGVDVTLYFLTSLPVNDEAAIPSSMYTTTPEDARIVEARVTPRRVEMPFYSAVRGLVGAGTGRVSAEVDATAFAAAGNVFCDVPPLFFCKPAGRNLMDDNEIGTQVKLKSEGSDTWGPGNFGYLSVESYFDAGGSCSGVKSASPVEKIGCMIAAENNISKCVPSQQLMTYTGNKVGTMQAALNVRFNLFEATQNINDGSSGFTVAPNIISGKRATGTTANKCDPLADSPLTIALPQANVIAADTDKFSDANNWTTDTIPLRDVATGRVFVVDNGGTLETVTGTLQSIYLATNHPVVTPNAAGTGPKYTFTQTTVTYGGEPAIQIQMADATSGNPVTDASLIKAELLDTRTGLDVLDNPATASVNEWKVAIESKVNSAFSGTLTDAQVAQKTAMNAAIDFVTEVGAENTRFGTYLMEIANSYADANGYIIDPTTLGIDGNAAFDIQIDETGIGMCDRETSVDPFRRVIIAAQVDCGSESADALNGKSAISTAEFVMMFLTEPGGNDGGGDFDLYGEVIGRAEIGIEASPGSQGRIRNVVQLLR